MKLENKQPLSQHDFKTLELQGKWCFHSLNAKQETKQN